MADLRRSRPAAVLLALAGLFLLLLAQAGAGASAALSAPGPDACTSGDPTPTGQPDPTCATTEPTTEPTTDAPTTAPTTDPTAPTTGPTEGPTGEPTTDAPTTPPTPAPTSTAPTTPGPTTPAPTDGPTDPAGTVEVDDAVFAWGMSQQSNALSHNPLTFNFFSAGQANPGRGATELPQSKWSARSGQVTIQKRNSSGAWKKATWSGLGTDAAGRAVGVYGPFSNHRVRIGRGTGTLDPGADDATLTWRGTWTVLYYGGHTVFTLTDPVLDVRNGVGRLTATAGGWASDRQDASVWAAVPARKVTVAEFTGVDITRDGVVLTPRYAGVQVSGTVPQDRTVDGWGSFPQSLISFLEPMGSDQFWYSTGLQADWTKRPQPIQVGWHGKAPETDDPTEQEPTEDPTNAISTAPPLQQQPVTPSVPVPGDLLGVPPANPVAAAVAAAVPPPVQVQRAEVAPLAAAVGESNLLWWAGGGLLLASAALLVLPGRRRAH